MRSCVVFRSFTISTSSLPCFTIWLTGRLIDLVAEDNAIEDTIYHMTRALDNERIDLDRYMKVCPVGPIDI
jgi:ESCRT-I complex subunit TSG101